MNIAFACPSYGPIDPKVVHAQRHAIMMAWANGIEVNGDIWIDRAGWDTARNRIAYSFLAGEHNLDGIFWCDSDTILSPDAIINLVAPGVDVCTGIYYGRHPPFEPQIHVYNEDCEAWNRILEWPEKDLFPVHGHGFGCVYTSRRALELTQQVDFDGPPAVNIDTGELSPQERRWWFRTGKWGEDLTWCHHARKMGLILWCNPNVEVGHLGLPHVITKDDFKKFYVENKTEAHIAAMTLARSNDGKYEAKVVKGLGPTVDGQGTTPGTHHSVGLAEHLRMTPSA